MFTPANSVDLTRVVKAADSLPAEQYSNYQQNALSFARKHFDREKYYPQLIGFYNQLVK